ncbi:preprotein translocase subunit SecE [Tepidiforma sp.]|uniref:preprotein translocase subunit SecE n=1 Tax=Tepidiforma sp. TaxID=2682230 RepID=UPI002ADE3CE5|nr:preprotein translocase subunit SecE [Tepidiforma sp.]
MARTPRRRAATIAPSAAKSAEGSPRVSQGLPRPAPAGGPIARPEAPRRNPFGFLKRLEPRFVADIIAELQKVTWPSFQETRYLTIVVAIVAVLMGLFLGTVDLVFGWIIERLFF